MMDRRRIALIGAALLIVLAIATITRHRRPDPKPVGISPTVPTSGSLRLPPPVTTSAASTIPVEGSVDGTAVASAREWAIGFVASTGDLLAMGPIRFRDEMRRLTAPELTADLVTAMETERAALAEDANTSTQAQVWIETPIAATTGSSDGGMVIVSVWSVVVNARPEIGPSAGWRTSTLTLQPHVETGWRLSGFDSVPGPTPVAGDELPAEWADFADVAAWPAAEQSLVGGGINDSVGGGG